MNKYYIAGLILAPVQTHVGAEDKGIKSGVVTNQYRSNYDTIFGKKSIGSTAQN